MELEALPTVGRQQCRSQMRWILKPKVSRLVVPVHEEKFAEYLLSEPTSSSVDVPASPEVPSLLRPHWQEVVLKAA